MSKPIGPIVCSVEAARIIGAKPYLTPPKGLNGRQLGLFIVCAATHAQSRGLLPVLTHGLGAVWTLDIDPDAHRSH